jgi:hypothetical protein
MSIFDWVGSLVGGAILGYFLGLRGFMPWFIFIVGWIFLGVLAHAAFGIDTMFGYYLGINPIPVREDCE